MNKLFRADHLTPFEADYARWCAEQGNLLRQGRLDALDRDNLAEEIESLGRKDRREIEHRLNVLLTHLLKWELQPKARKGGWRATIREQREQIAKLVGESPSLRGHPAKELEAEYKSARLNAIDETGLDESEFPPACPYKINDVLDEGFLPGPAWSRNS